MKRSSINEKDEKQSKWVWKKKMMKVKRESENNINKDKDWWILKKEI
jgi:hypothetical protein